MAFLVKGPIYLVCISCTEEPYESLRSQLELLYGQVGTFFYFTFLLSLLYDFIHLSFEIYHFTWDADGAYTHRVCK